MNKINPQIFHAYDVRGIYPEEINPETAYCLGLAFGKFLKDDLKAAAPIRVVLGLDMRGSSPFLALEEARALGDLGIDVIEVGLVPTPAFYYAIAFKDYAGGVMVTASHNPKQYNGLKFAGARAAPIGLGTGLEKIKIYADAAQPPKPSGKGQFLSLPGVVSEYVARDLSYLNSGKIQKLKIAADPANAMGALYLEELFRKIPCEPIKINWDLNGNMPIHEANPLKAETLQQLQEIIKNEAADFGIATDGDGDRIAFLDEKAAVIPASIITGLVAQELLKKNPGAKIGYDLRSSRITKEMIEQAGGQPVETKVGHSNIKALMNEQDILFAGELSSHYYFRENYNYESPVFVTATLLFLRSQSGMPFSEICRPYQKYYHSGEINFEVADKNAAMEKLEKKYAAPPVGGKISKLDGVKIDLGQWWFNVRPSNTEPLLRLNLEADTEELMRQKLEEISSTIKS